MEQVANQCAIALRQSRLYQAAQAQVQELERLNGLKDDFLSTVSHEPHPDDQHQNGYPDAGAEFTKRDGSETSAESVDRYLRVLKDECQREIGLINDLLDLTRLDTGTEPLFLTTINFPSWVAHLVEPFKERIYHQQQQLAVDVPAELPDLKTNPSYLERILTELLNNACKYTPAGR